MSLPFKIGKSKMKKRTFTDEQFIEAVKLATSIRQVLVQLNLKEAGFSIPRSYSYSIRELLFLFPM